MRKLHSEIRSVLPQEGSVQNLPKRKKLPNHYKMFHQSGQENHVNVKVNGCSSQKSKRTISLFEVGFTQVRPWVHLAQLCTSPPPTPRSGISSPGFQAGPFSCPTWRSSQRWNKGMGCQGGYMGRLLKIAPSVTCQPNVWAMLEFLKPMMHQYQDASLLFRLCWVFHGRCRRYWAGLCWHGVTGTGLGYSGHSQ